MIEKDINERIRAGILEATRLTHSGQLFEATAAIQRALQATFAPESAVDIGKYADKLPIEGVFDLIDEAERDARDKTNDQGRFVAGTYTNQAGSRAYKLYIPSAYDEGKQDLPLIVMLHGTSQTPDDFAAGTRMNELAEDQHCLVVYPAQSPEANAAMSWNWFRSEDQQRDRGEPSIIAGITREIIANYRVDAQRVYAAGLSSGGAMAAIMGSTYPDVYAAIGVHSGLSHGAAYDLPSALAVMAQGDGLSGFGFKPNGPKVDVSAQIVPAIVFHGDRDATVHSSNSNQFISQRERVAEAEQDPRVHIHREPASADSYPYTRTCHIDVDGQTVLEHWLIHGAGHAWFGGCTAGTYADPKGPDATKAMFRFFQQHRRRA